MRTRLRLKLLSLSALVIGVMAIGPTGVAQAEFGACAGYMSGANLLCFSASLAPKAGIVLENSTGTLLINNVNLEILCTAVSIIETSGITGHSVLGRAELSGCIALSKTPTLSKLNSCTPNDPVAGLGKIRTEKGIGLILLHNGEPVIELRPDEGGILAKMFLGEECAVSEELIVTGKLVLSDSGGKASFEQHKLSHLAQEFPSLKLMKVGVNAATIDGTANITLVSPHNALLWGGHAG